MKRGSRAPALALASFSIFVCATLALVLAEFSYAQGNSHERSFPQSKPVVEKALRGMQASMAGHLPVLDGFAVPGDHSLDRYQRAYYQSTVQVIPNPAGGSLVRVSTKVTAWYADPSASRSGYQLLTSNGRLEADLLDQLADVLASGVSAAASNSPATAAPSPIRQDAVTAAELIARASTARRTSKQPQTGSPGQSECSSPDQPGRRALVGSADAGRSARTPECPKRLRLRSGRWIRRHRV